MHYLENIRPTKGTAAGLFVLLLLIAAVSFGQPRIRIDNINACDHSEVVVPVRVNDFLDIGSFTLYIYVDTASVSLLSISDANDQLAAGTVESNLDKVNQRLIIAWFGMTPANIEDGKLLDIHLELKSPNADLAFQQDSELTLSDLSIIENVDFTSGSAAAFDAFQTSPAVSTVNEGATVSFSVPAIEGLSYQWQVKEQDEWSMLVNNDVYAGVSTNALQINSVPLELNDHQYRCLISNDICTGASLPSKLEVTVGIIEHGFESSGMRVYPNPAGEAFSFSIENNIIYNGILMIKDIHGSILIEKRIPGMNADNIKSIDISSLSAGLYLVEWRDEKRGAQDVVKLLKQ